MQATLEALAQNANATFAWCTAVGRPPQLWVNAENCPFPVMLGVFLGTFRP